MINKTPLVSIIIPSYNQGEFIEDTIMSILLQDYPSIEVIVVDAVSTDNTLEILEKYQNKISYISESDNGQSDAINKGLKLVKGEIITWLNSDDIYPDRHAVSSIVDSFHKNSDVSLVYGDFLEIDEANKVLRILKRPGFSFKKLLRIGYISQPATFFLRNVVDEMSINENLRYAMDLEYWLCAHSKGFRFVHIPFVVAAERVHGAAKCVRDCGDMEEEAKIVRRKYGAKLDNIHYTYRFFDRLGLYIRRLIGISDLIFYMINDSRLTVSLDFSNSIRGTIWRR